MRTARAGLGLVLCLLGPWACKDQGTLQAEAKVERFETRLQEGRDALAAGAFEQAIRAFRGAAAEKPRDPIPHMYLGDAYRQDGNEPAAELSWRTAEQLAAGADDATRSRIAQLYRDAGNTQGAIKTWLLVAENDKLTRTERLELAQLQAREGDFDGAYKTLGPLQLKDPDDPEAKVVEAEALLLSGEEVKATAIMDRVIAAQPNLAAARVLRARYFFNNGFPDMALQDLAALRGQDVERTDAVALQARIYLSQGKFDEAQSALTALLKKRPTDVEFLSQLAEIDQAKGQLDQAEALVDQALRQDRGHPRAVYVRARIREDKGDLDEALKSYRMVTRVAPNFAPAYARLWRIHDVRKEYDEATRALEKLYLLNEAGPEEKVKLAELYARSRKQVSRGLALIDEALKREPENPTYREIRAKLLRARPMKKPPMVIQMK